jgi:hypothetical protein
MIDYPKLTDEQKSYYLYLEGIANELSHILQTKRKEMGLSLLDWVDVAVVENPLTKLSTAVLTFVNEIVDRCRIKLFLMNPLKAEGARLWKDEKIEDAFHNFFIYDLYIGRD